MSTDHATSTRVYRLLKADVLSNVLGSGSPVNVAALGRLHGTSVTPVREALLRLVGEGHVDLLSTGGFKVRVISSSALLAAYQLNEVVLHHAVASVDYSAREALSADTISPSRAAEGLFADLALRTRSQPIIRLVMWMNERLARPRAIEERIFGDLSQEAAELAEALLIDRRTAVRSIRAYHRRRRERADDIAALLAR